jgi:four helix bundle protein
MMSGLVIARLIFERGRLQEITRLEKSLPLAINADRIANEIRDADHKPLRGQLNRAALSIPTNIVEGRAKTSDRDFARFLGYALGSATELEHHIMIGRDVGAIPEGDASSLLSQVVEIKRMLHGLIERLLGQ